MKTTNVLLILLSSIFLIGCNEDFLSLYSDELYTSQNLSKLEIKLEHDKKSPYPLDIIVKLINGTDHNISYPASAVPSKNGLIYSDYFTVIENGEKVTYSKPLEQNTTSTNWTSLPAGEIYKVHVSIDKNYKLKKGNNKYAIIFGSEDNPYLVSKTLTTKAYIK